MKTDFPKILRDLISCGYTQQQIADVAGVTQGRIAQVLNDESGEASFMYEPGAALVAWHAFLMRCEFHSVAA